MHAFRGIFHELADHKYEFPDVANVNSARACMHGCSTNTQVKVEQRFTSQLLHYESHMCVITFGDKKKGKDG
jgi:hypothetical protein